MGQMAEGATWEEEDGGQSGSRSLMCRSIGEGQCQARWISSISWMKGAKAAVAGESGVGMRASSCGGSGGTSSIARLRFSALSLFEEGGRAMAIIVMPSRSTALDVAAREGLKSNEVEGYCASGGISGEG